MVSVIKKCINLLEEKIKHNLPNNIVKCYCMKYQIYISNKFTTFFFHYISKPIYIFNKI